MMLQAYAIPAMEVKLKLARANLPPHTIMRGPGYLQAVMVIEQVCYWATVYSLQCFGAVASDCAQKTLLFEPPCSVQVAQLSAMYARFSGTFSLSTLHCPPSTGTHVEPDQYPAGWWRFPF